MINDDFLNSMEWKVEVDMTTAKAVGRFNRNDRKEVEELFEGSVTTIGTASIASVCHTDSQTVDLILQEIVATVAA